MKKYYNEIYDILMNEFVSFWETHSTDPLYGGYFAALTATETCFTMTNPCGSRAEVSGCFQSFTTSSAKRRYGLTRQNRAMIL